MSVFRESLVFFDQVGLYDVILPFLLIFTLVFGVLEKSRIFGTEEVGGAKYSRKNLNAMVAFVMGFFVVASAQLVSLINIFVARIALILVILVMFMILVASFHKQEKESFALEKWAPWLMWVVFIAVILIFLDGLGWLGPAWDYVTGNWDSQIMGTAFLFAIVVGFIFYITNEPKAAGDKPK